MATGSNEYGLVRDSFPNNIARSKKEPTEFSEMSTRQVKPTSQDALFDWATVIDVASGDPSRSHELVYKTGSADARQLSSFSRVSIRLFGVLGRHNFLQYGNWSGDEHTAHKATFFATLEPGPFSTQYNDQVAAVEDVKRLVFKHLSGFRENRRHEKQDLFLQRRVFEKVDRSGAARSSFRQEAMPASDSKLQELFKKWRMADGIQFGRKTDAGSIVACDPLIFNDGDFVDIQATFEIITTSRRDRQPVGAASKTVTVHISPSQIVRLMKGEELAKITGPLSKPTAIPARPAVVAEEKLKFDEENVFGDPAVSPSNVE
ncbi:uncharacterized protein STEHIDRAFT_113949 [Stereum hirsutum FP-91666 SS1]|uniref:uncharacterized protein n=1 Tax=Stereum hirsutum (strain FP-91666) TaxID=721885 RepID=UPI0004449AAB|nr:uncharacterized protein STEHIDRAFT_113949 [Stereum hirsutum FP-91666 SS1]EIM82859.1 hypothetical protein STEHIDRAFT_113949 [Stereum hirsutum FP-91666 SS1]